MNERKGPSAERATRSHVLLLGATGFIGVHLRDALIRAGYRVTCGARCAGASVSCPGIAVDYSRDLAEADWLPRLVGVDAVINAVGILRETPDASFEALHVATPRALFSACLRAGVAKVIQISALGADDAAVSAYHLSKKAGDDALASMPLAWVIVQPSLVFGPTGASAALFTTLAALPLIPLPGAGDQRIQPVHIEDLADAIVRLLQTDAFDRTRVPAVGPQPLALHEYLRILRYGMNLGRAHFVRVPMPFVRAAARIGEFVPGALLDRESLEMLVRGNTASPDVFSAVLERSPREPQSFVKSEYASALAAQARLRWLLPVLRAALAFVWIFTGIVSLGVYPVSESLELLARVGLEGAGAMVTLYAAALIDIAFGIAIYVLRRGRRWLWRAQIMLIVGYTALITLFLPEFWLHPYGPVLKNLPLLAAILLLHEFEARAES